MPVKLRIPLFLSIALFVIGMAFRIMHWPYWDFISIAALLGVLVTSTLQFALKPQKHWTDLLRFITVLLFLTWVLQTLFHLPFKTPILLALAGCLFTLFISSGYSLSFGFAVAPKGKNVELIRYAGITFVLMGAVFKVQHWPYGGTLLVIGLSLSTFQYIYQAFRSDDEDEEMEA